MVIPASRARDDVVLLVPPPPFQPEKCRKGGPDDTDGRRAVRGGHGFDMPAAGAEVVAAAAEVSAAAAEVVVVAAEVATNGSVCEIFAALVVARERFVPGTVAAVGVTAPTVIVLAAILRSWHKGPSS